MKWKTRTIVVTLLGLVLAAGLLAPVALGSQAGSPDSHPPQQHAEERLGNTLAEMVQEGIITQEQAYAILERIAPILAQASMDSRPPQDRIAQHLRGIIRQTVGLLGLEPEVIVAQLREGHTLAEIAEAQGVTLDELVNAITADAHEKLAEAVASGRLSQEEADERLERMRDQVTRVVINARGPALLGQLQPPQNRIAQHLRGIIKQTVGLLGLEPEAIVAQLRAGHTLAEIAEAQGVTLDELVNAITADAHEKLAEAVASGRLSQEEADERLERMRDQVTRVVINARGPALLGQLQPPQNRIAQHLRGIIKQTVGLLGLEPEAIVAQLRAGHTLAEIAEAQGVTLEELVSAITAAWEADLAKAVEAGKLTQQEADERLERTRHELTRLVTNRLPI